jgi:hypothetical protein
MLLEVSRHRIILLFVTASCLADTAWAKCTGPIVDCSGFAKLPEQCFLHDQWCTWTVTEQDGGMCYSEGKQCHEIGSKSSCIVRPGCSWEEQNDGASTLEECFSATTTIQVEQKGTIMMKDLQRGDKVLTKSGDYHPVYAFAHYHHTVQATFLQFHFSAPSTTRLNLPILEITGGHLLFVQDQEKPVPARSVKVGDEVQVIVLDAEKRNEDVFGSTTKHTTVPASNDLGFMLL